MSNSAFFYRLRGILLPAIIAVAIATPEARACGRDTDCVIGDRSYRVALPEKYDGTTPIGAIIFAHGYRGTAKGVMKNKALTALASELGVAFIAAQAVRTDWQLPGAPHGATPGGSEELAYFDALIEDVTDRFAIDRTRLVMSGFSAGAMMTWYLACNRGNAFTGFVPMSGTFWAPVPVNCQTGPVNLIHYHGDADPVVPLGGRPIGDARQGDVSKAIELITGLGDYQPVESSQTPGLDCTRQVNSGGKLLELCLFSGGHQMKTKYLARAWRIFEAAWGN